MTRYMFGKQELVIPSINMLSTDSEINGDIKISGDFRFDGKLYGSIKCSGKITIGSTGYIEGQIECKNAEISGEIKGTIKVAELLILKETCAFSGDINTGKLMVENGAKLSMKCNTDVVEIKK